jgi:SPP1 family predicted phage head-tail adaptor
MSILDYFLDLHLSPFSIYNPTATYNESTGVYEETYSDSGNTVDGVMYNRSAAERYFSERFQPDVTEVLVIEYTTSIDTTTRLLYDGKMYAIDSVVDVAGQNEIILLGLREFT